MPKFLTVISVSDVRKDKNGRDYKLVELSNPEVETYVDEDTGEIIKALVEAKSVMTTAYKESYLNDKPSFLWKATEGMKVVGSIETRPVRPYVIGDREVNTYSAAVFVKDDHPLFEVAVQKVFKSAGHPLVGDVPAEAPKAAVKQAPLKPLEPTEEKPKAGVSLEQITKKDEEEAPAQAGQLTF